jgi:uncharacterized protein (DUF2147 family)
MKKINLSFMTFSFTILTLTSFVPSLALANMSDAVGRWKTIDDATGKAKSIVEIVSENGEIKGRVAELINPSEPNPVCKKCEGEKKNAPIQGLEIIWGLKPTGEGKWGNGRIMDPQNGKIYSCHLKLTDGGKKLEVRGYLGFSFAGRTQVWHRAD